MRLKVQEWAGVMTFQVNEWLGFERREGSERLVVSSCSLTRSCKLCEISPSCRCRGKLIIITEYQTICNSASTSIFMWNIKLQYYRCLLTLRNLHPLHKQFAKWNQCCSLLKIVASLLATFLWSFYKGSKNWPKTTKSSWHSPFKCLGRYIKDAAKCVKWQSCELLLF